MEEVGRGFSWILGFLVGCGVVSSFIFLICKKEVNRIWMWMGEYKFLVLG